ncbi:MAG: hypothetical protein AAFV29_05435 [Myxococcota bacterium]
MSMRTPELALMAVTAVSISLFSVAGDRRPPPEASNPVLNVVPPGQSPFTINELRNGQPGAVTD